jgi:hypothetical protein
MDREDYLQPRAWACYKWGGEDLNLRPSSLLQPDALSLSYLPEKWK